MDARDAPSDRLASALLLAWALLRALTLVGVAAAAVATDLLGELTPLLLASVVALIVLRGVPRPHRER